MQTNLAYHPMLYWFAIKLAIVVVGLALAITIGQAGRALRDAMRRTLSFWERRPLRDRGSRHQHRTSSALKS